MGQEKNNRQRKDGFVYNNTWHWQSEKLPCLVARSLQHEGGFVVRETHFESTDYSMSGARKGMDYLHKKFSKRSKDEK